MSTPAVPEAAGVVARTVAAYEPEATAAVVARPGALLSVLLVAATRAVEAVTPLVAASERKHTAAACSKAIAERDAWWQQRLRDAVSAERERCARLAEQHGAIVTKGYALAGDTSADTAWQFADLLRQEQP